MLVRMSCWTTTSLASYFPSRSSNMPLSYSFQDSSNFYLVMSARDDRDLVNCQGPCHQVSPSNPVYTFVGQLADQASGKHHWSVSGHCAQRRHQKAAHRGRGDGGALASGQAVRRWLERGAQLQVPPRAPTKGNLAKLDLFTFLSQIGLIRLKLWEGARLIADSGNIIGMRNLLSFHLIYFLRESFVLISCIFKDDGPGSLKGGRLGVYCDSQVTKNRKSM